MSSQRPVRALFPLIALAAMLGVDLPRLERRERDDEPPPDVRPVDRPEPGVVVVPPPRLAEAERALIARPPIAPPPEVLRAPVHHRASAASRGWRMRTVGWTDACPDDCGFDCRLHGAMHRKRARRAERARRAGR